MTSIWGTIQQRHTFLTGTCLFRLQWGPQKVASTLSGYYSHCLSHYRSNPEPVQPSLEKSPSAWLTSSHNGAQLTVQHSVKRTWKRLWRKVLHRKDLQTGAMLTKKKFLLMLRKCLFAAAEPFFIFVYFVFQRLHRVLQNVTESESSMSQIFATGPESSGVESNTSPPLRRRRFLSVFQDNFSVSLVTICSN